MPVDAEGCPGDAPTDRQQAEGLLAALIFAVHPIHTEAVAGIVGQAELISAAMSILALLTYIRACWPGWASAALPIKLHAISLCCPGAAMCSQHERKLHDTELTGETDGMHNLNLLWGAVGKSMHGDFPQIWYAWVVLLLQARSIEATLPRRHCA